MSRLALILAGVSLIAASSAANAADLMMPADTSPAYSPPAHDWTGFYAGINGGYAAGTVDWSGTYYDAGGAALGPSTDGTMDLSGWLAGGTIGANMQMGSFVLGVEGDVDWTNITGEGDAIDPLDPNPSVPSTKLDWLATLRARAGIAVDNLVLYGTAGGAWSGGSMTITNLDGAGDDETADITASGWTAGVGAEYALSDNMSVKAEYLYTRLSMDPVDFTNVPPADHLTAKGTADINTIKLGLNFKF